MVLQAVEILVEKSHVTSIPMRFQLIILALFIVCVWDAVDATPTGNNSRKKKNPRAVAIETKAKQDPKTLFLEETATKFDKTLVPVSAPKVAEKSVTVVDDESGECLSCARVLENGTNWVVPRVCAALVGLGINTYLTAQGYDKAVIAVGISLAAGAADTTAKSLLAAGKSAYNNFDSERLGKAAASMLDDLGPM
jgi:hypothetical protein